MKKLISLALITITLVLTLSGCAFDKKKKVALVVSGVEVSSEIYAYYLDLVKQRPGDYGLESNHKAAEEKDAALKLCVNYVALNTRFAQRELKLTTAQKIQIADNVNSYWIRSEKHCKALGISRKTINKIYTANAYSEAIFTSLYDKGTDDAKAEDEIKNYFYTNYTAFGYVCAYFTNADGTNISKEQKQTLITNFNEIAKASGDSRQSFANACEEKGYTPSDLVILKKNSEGYPAGFFLKVYVMPANTVKVFDYDDCVFTIRKEDLKEMGESIYAQYRDDCIEDMYAEVWQKSIDNYVANFTIDEVYV